jgi:hypothetical protein
MISTADGVVSNQPFPSSSGWPPGSMGRVFFKNQETRNKKKIERMEI